MVKLNETEFGVQPPGPVYHGTGAGIAAGDTVRPHHDRTWNTSAAFGVTDEATAGYFGLEKARRPRPGGQGRLFASVYEVEPKSRFDLHPSDQKSYDQQAKYRKEYQPEPEVPVNNMPVDRKGFKVVRHAAYSFPDPEGEKKGHLYEKLQMTP